MTGIQEKTALVKAGLEALVARESAKRAKQMDDFAEGLKRFLGADEVSEASRFIAANTNGGYQIAVG